VRGERDGAAGRRGHGGQITQAKSINQFFNQTAQKEISRKKPLTFFTYKISQIKESDGHFFEPQKDRGMILNWLKEV
jgi:hypothetical protein